MDIREVLMLSRWSWFTSYDSRTCEWMTSVQITGFGIFLGLPMTSLHHTQAVKTVALIMPEWAWSWMFAMVGAILLNSMHNPEKARWRAVLRAVMFYIAMMAYLIFGMAIFSASYYSPGVYMYFSTSALFCGASFFRACRDAAMTFRA